MDTTHIRCALTIAAVSLAVLSLGLAPAVAEPNDNTGPGESFEVATSPYVQADSPEEAEEILDDLENQQADRRGASPQRVKLGPCTITAEGIHLRKSGNYNTVGFKTKTKCDTEVTSIRHDIRLREKTLPTYWKEIVPTSGPSNHNSNEASLTSKGTSFLCVSKSPARWWSGSALGAIVYNGETYYARDYAPTSAAKIACAS